MEEAVGARRDSLVAVYASGTDDADWRLLRRHHAGLHRRCVRAEQHVRRTLDEECVLHVARRMVGSEVQSENTCQSSSTSGPSATVNPRREKIEIISLRISEIGWRVPSGETAAGRVRSIAASHRRWFQHFTQSVDFVVASTFNWLSF